MLTIFYITVLIIKTYSFSLFYHYPPIIPIIMQETYSKALILLLSYFLRLIYINNSLNMKIGVLPLNVVVSVAYIVLAGLVLYIVKLATQPLTAFSPTSPSKHPLITTDTPIYRMMATAWLKKYTLLGSSLIADKKYLLKELLIISVYAVACLHINKLTLWPVSLITFLLPATYLLYDVLSKHIEQENSNQIKAQNAIHEVQIEIEAVGMEAVRVVSTEQVSVGEKREKKEDRTWVEVGIVGGLAFLSVVLYSQTVMVLGNSISNSGELNIISILSILSMDQFLLRPFSGLLLLGTIKILEKMQKLTIQTNKIVVFLCQEQLIEEELAKVKQKTKAMLQNTQGHLKPKQQDGLRCTNMPMHIDQQNFHIIDLNNIRPSDDIICFNEEQQKEHQQHADEDKLTVEIYLTTPEKELFQGDNICINNQTIMDDYLYNKQNTQNSVNRPRLFSHQHQQTKSFQELVLAKDPLQDIQNFKPTLQHTLSPIQQMAHKQANNKRKNKRQLRITGNSPYLQYLPNMLKNVRKGGNTTALVAPKISENMLR